MQNEIQNYIESYRLSPEQKHLWLQQQSGGASFRVQCGVSIEGEIDLERLKEALKKTVEKHEILRTSFQIPGGMTIPVQTVFEAFEPSITERDLTDLDGDAQSDALESIFQEVKKKSFDFGQKQLLIASLIRLSSHKFYLILALPALCADSESLVNLTGDVAAFYRAREVDEGESDSVLQYADFAEWHNEILAAESENEERKFWHEQKINPDFNLYFENENSKEKNFDPQVLINKIDSETAARIKAFAASKGILTGTFLLACWQILLWYLSGESDFTLGLYTEGRKFQEMETSLGLFARCIPLPTQIIKTARFDAFLNLVRETAGKAANWQEFFGWKQLRNTTTNKQQEPFLSFCFESMGGAPEFRADDVVFKIVRQYSCLDRFKMRLACAEREGALITEFYFDTALYQIQDVERLADSFNQLLESAVNYSSQAIGSLKIMSEAERRRLLEGFNQTQFDYRSDICAHQLFEEIAAKTPEKTAIICEDGELTYGELNARANQLARHLQSHGAEPGTLTAICAERSFEMVVGILGILKTGSGYVPLDPAYPKDRLEYILEDTHPKILLKQKHLLKELPANEAKVVFLDSDGAEIGGQSSENLGEKVSTENLAYVIYTSGSTGKPKGAMITHANLGHYAQALSAAIGLKDSDRYLHTASISFSSSVRQLMLPLSKGAAIVMASGERIRNPLSLLDMVKERDVTVVDFVPSYWRNLLYALDNAPEEKANSLLENKLRLMLSASEPLPSDVTCRLSAKFKPNVKIINMLGQTETTGIISINSIDNLSNLKDGIVCVGRPIFNARIYLLDSDLNPVPFGAPGEIFIGGKGIGRGYLNHPELTAERFIANPFSNDPKARLYKTGDLGRYNSDGKIEFLGRIDGQVKIRGHRIEPEEIEVVLRQHKSVRDAVVIARDDSQGGQKLVAYIVPQTGNAPTAEGRERYLLPNNMAIVHQNKHETDFFYKQIFLDQTNFKHGIKLDDGAWVVDVGANIGFFTMFVQQLWKNVKVFAFEPIPAIFETLRINTALYGKNTTLFRCGLAEEEKEVAFTYYPNSTTQSGRYADEQEEREVLRSIIGNQQSENGFELSEQFYDRLVEERIHGEKVVCPLKTLSQIIRENEIEQIDLLKIDAEKSELDVLRGIEDADWRKIKQIVIEAHDTDGHLKQLINLLEKHGFTVFAEEDSYIKGSGLYNVYAARTPKNEKSNPQASASYPIPVIKEEILTAGELRQYLKNKLPDYLVPSSFVLLESLPMTPNGKVDRKTLPEPGEIRPVAEKGFAAPKDELEIRLTKIWEQLLGIQPIGTGDNFFDLGGHSLLAVRLFSQIEKLFNKNLPLATLFEAPTIKQLADLLRQKGWQPSWSSLITLQAKGTKRPFFFIHALGGNVLEYHPLARFLGEDQPSYALQSLGLDKKQTPHKTIEEMAAHYIREIRTIQPDGPYLIGGRSLGGTVAFEMACQLTEQNQKVALLALLDTDPMGYHKLLPDSGSRLYKAGRLIKRVNGHVGNLHQLTAKEKINYFRGKAKYVPGKIKNKLWQAAYKFYLSAGRPLPSLLRSVGEFNFMAVMNYVPKIYPGKATLFWANEDLRGTYDVEAGWNFLVQGGVEIHNIPGNHLDIVKEPYVQVLAEKLKACIDNAQEGEAIEKQVSSADSKAQFEAETNDQQWNSQKPAAVF